MSMEEKELIECKSCGGFHDPADCEIIVIKLVKGKNCPIPTFGKTVVKEVFVKKNNGQVITEEKKFAPPANAQNETIPTEVPKKKNIIPAAMLGLMLDPGHPQFEQFGAKETRRV